MDLLQFGAVFLVVAQVKIARPALTKVDDGIVNLVASSPRVGDADHRLDGQSGFSQLVFQRRADEFFLPVELLAVLDVLPQAPAAASEMPTLRSDSRFGGFSDLNDSRPAELFADRHDFRFDRFAGNSA